MTWHALLAAPTPGDYLLATIAGVPASVGVYLVYKGTRKRDVAIEQSGMVDQNRAGAALVIEGLKAQLAGFGAFIDVLQEERADSRATVKVLTTRLEACLAEGEAYRHENARLRRKYGNGDEAI